MPRLDPLSLPVRDWQKSGDWYLDQLGFEVEFEIADRDTAAMRDDADLTIFLHKGEVPVCPGTSFTIPFDDVEATHRRLVSAGIFFDHPPMKVLWGYDAELRDPDGHTLRLWDQKSMKEKGGGQGPMKFAPWLALLGLLLIAGCAGNGDGSQNDKHSGFYGGVSSGGSRP